MGCKFIRENGDVCKARALIGKNYCFFHNPESKEDLAVAVRNGGLNSRKNNLSLPQRAIRSPRDVIIVIEETLNHLRAGNIHPNYSNSIFIGCNALMKAHEQSEIITRLNEIEKKLGTPEAN
ncbi:hypothetical protein HY382_01975 [Candidatus Curtissbacteria bacterium]|nr:hypothetical protein [Candidatus Curtissbacteria bacterium]